LRYILQNNKRARRNMKILITTQYLNNFTGSEIFTFNLAEKLGEKGHEVCVFSPVLGSTISKKLKKIGIDVSDNILDFENHKFNIIHAQHNVTAILARSVFPDAPMFFMSHGYLPELEQPPSIDLGIEKFIVISEEIKDYFVKKYSLSEEKIKMVRNSIDVNRFSSQKKPHSKAKKLLVLSNHYTDNCRRVIEGACKDLKLNVIHVGLPENPVPPRDVSKFINDSDIVVALGRGALEAMACGRNVIVYDMHGGDGFVDEKNFFEIRKNNFSGRRFGKKYTIDSFKKEIEKYNPNIGKALANIIHKEHSVDKLTDDLLNIYSEKRGKNHNKYLKKSELYREINFLEKFNSYLEKQTKICREEINERDKELQERDKELQERDKELQERDKELQERDKEFERVNIENSYIKNSRVWRMRNIIAKIVGKNVIK